MAKQKAVKIRCKGSALVDVAELQPRQGNLKTLSKEAYQMLRGLIEAGGFSFAPFVWRNPQDGSLQLLDGHQRRLTLLKMREEGWQVPPIPICEVEAATEQEADEKLLAVAAQFGKVDKQGLYEFLETRQVDYTYFKSNIHFIEIDKPSFELEFYKDNAGDGTGDGAGEGGEQANPTTLQDRFLVPPFSVLDARQGYWQDRKRAWLSLGIESEVGRGANLLKMSDTVMLSRSGANKSASFNDQDKLSAMRKGKATQGAVPGNPEATAMGGHYYRNQKKGEAGEGLRDYGEENEGGDAWAKTGTSIFDPVLCEIAYRWFAPKGAWVLDPFAGGSVRGIVASKLGLYYTGLELRGEQVAANAEQAAKICDGALPKWITGDSRKTLPKLGGEFDLLFSCPPYADLEVYSEDPDDLSNMPYEKFLAAYREIIVGAVARLKPNRFAVWVIGEVRAKTGGGAYRGLVPDTIRAFQDAGADFYNEGILVTSVGTLPLRCGRIFVATRKLGKTHQNVLVFCKGDPRKATEACGEVEVADIVSEEHE